MKAIIFDLDGVICHTDEYHYLAWKAMADGLGVHFDREINNRLRGVSRMASLEIVLENYNGQLSPAEKEALATQKNELYKESLKNMSPADLSAEVKTTLDTLRDRGYKLAIGSSSKNAPFILQQLGLGDYFDAISDGNNITRSKPDPEVFVKAAQMLCMPCEECLVVEDAVSGAQAGHAGGMKVACVGDAAREKAGDYIKRYMNADFVMMHDDWGNQSNMFLSPDMWRKFYKEPERRMAQRAHKLGMYYMHHSCGYITPIVGDLVEIGVDSWHSVQPVNDLKGLKEAYGDKIVFAGAVDPQVTDRPGATEEEIRAEVRRVIDTLGKGGGLMASSAVMFSTVQGVDAIIDDEGKKYGRYDTLKFA